MTDIMEARRKGFEESFPTPYFVTFNRDKKGYYSQFRDSTRKRAAECYDAKWIGYNAALDSVCVELPEDRDHRTTHTDDDSRQEGYNEALSDCREALFYAGLKVKP